MLTPLGITTTCFGSNLALKIKLFLVVFETAIILSQKGKNNLETLLKWISSIDLSPYNECYVSTTLIPRILAKNINYKAKVEPVWWQCTMSMHYPCNIFAAALKLNTKVG